MNFFSEKAQIYLHCIMFWRRVYKGSIVTLTSCKLEVSLVTSRNKVVAKVMFLHVSVILLTGGSLENPPPPGPGTHTPPRPRRTPPGPVTPPSRTKENPPRPRRTPPREEHCSIRSMSGRYASYWNAFLFILGLV